VVRQFEQFLAADAGQTQHLNGGERTELFLVAGQVASSAGDDVLGPDEPSDGVGGDGLRSPTRGAARRERTKLDSFQPTVLRSLG
jgi:hypothetical protein